MTALRRRMIADMQLRELSPHTQRAYLQSLRHLAAYFGRPPDTLSDDDIRHYFLYLRNDKQVGRAASTTALCALKFLYTYTLQRPWSYPRPRPAQETAPFAGCPQH
jgi:integrase/recombinase XerD